MSPTHRIVLCPACQAKLRVRMSDRRIALFCPNCSDRVDVQPLDGTDEATGQPIRQQPLTASSAPATQSSPVSQSPQHSANRGRGTADSWTDPSPKSAAARRGRLRLEDRAGSEASAAKKEILIVCCVLFCGLIGTAVALRFFFGGNGTSAPAIAQAAPAPAPLQPSPDLQTPGSFYGTASANNPATASPGLPTAPPASTAPSPIPSGFAQVPPGFAQAAPPSPAFPPQPPPAFPAGSLQPVQPAQSTQPPPPLRPGGRRLGYSWPQGEEYVYEFTIVEGEENDGRKTTGQLSYTVNGPVAGTPDEEEGTGTGFVITSDGVLATCAHVIERASSIEVVYQGQVYPATVIASDAATDVALIRINASGLSPLSLIDSEQLQLAESVLAVGFPLSDVLGNDVKVTTGTVAGLINDRDRGRRIQIDAALNPGNSGGPVVNSAGQVVGVASAKLTGNDVTAVGFAAPGNQLRSLAATQGITLPTIARAPAMAREEAARQVIPAVALVRVRGRSARAAVSLAYLGNFSTVSRERNGASTIPKFHSDSGTMQVNELGQVLEFDSKEQLPAVLGAAALLVMEQLGEVSDTQWTVESETNITRVLQAERPSGFAPRGFAPRFPPGFGRLPGFDQPEERIEQVPAVERTSWQAGQILNDKIAIRKTYELVASKKIGGQPWMVIRGSGDLVFDLTRCVPASLEYRAVIERNDEDGSLKVPVSVRYSLRNRDEVIRERQQAEADRAAREEQMRRETTIPDPMLIDEILQEIRKAEGAFGAYSHFDRLSTIAIAPEKRPDVLRAINNHLGNSNSTVRDSAVKALCHWATAAEIDQIKLVLEDKDKQFSDSDEYRLARVLLRFGSETDRIAVLDMLDKSYSMRSEVKLELIELGSTVENIVLQLIEKSTDASVRNEMLEVVKKIGTEKSIPLLEKLAVDDKFIYRYAAKEALDAIRARQ